MKIRAYLVTLIGLFLPYRLRVVYGIVLNFILNRPTKLFRLIINILNDLSSLILFFIVYFFVLPLVWITKSLLTKNRGSGFMIQNKQVLHKDFFRRF